jgi:putative transposase
MRRAIAQPGDERERDSELRRAAARRVVADLIAHRQSNELSAAEVREARAMLGVSERTLWRWVAAGRPLLRGRPSPRRLVLSDGLRDAYLRLGGNVAAVWRDAHERGLEPPPLRTLQAAFARELSNAEQTSARRGEAGRREHALYLRYEAPHRNAVWQADHKQLPVLVVAPGGRRDQRPWVTLFLDDFSRAIVGWAVSLRPSSAEVLAALRRAARPRRARPVRRRARPAALGPRAGVRRPRGPARGTGARHRRRPRGAVHAA